MNGTSTERESDNPTDNRLTLAGEKPNQHKLSAGWRRGYAADCKSVKTGSIPVPASTPLQMSMSGLQDRRIYCLRRFRVSDGAAQISGTGAHNSILCKGRTELS